MTRTAEAQYDQETSLHEVSAERVPSLIGQPDTIDAWRHERMLRLAQPLINVQPDAAWLTIGDGGADAWMLRQMGARQVTASSISDARLRTLASRGHLPDIEIRAINAERIDLPDRAIGFILCKEAFHHFPRAPIAFYEFMRVAHSGVLLIEPADFGFARPFDVLRTVSKLVLRRRPPVYELFEPVGNYIYRLSPREVGRMLTAMQVPWFAVRRFNDFSTRHLVNKRRDDVLPRAVFEAGLAVQNGLAAVGLMNPGFCAVFVPTGATGDDTRRALSDARFDIVETPRNPYSQQDLTRSFL